jgi:hypothetical protein
MIVEATRELVDYERTSLTTLIEKVWVASRSSNQVSPDINTVDGLLSMWLHDCPQWLQGQEGSLPVTEYSLDEAVKQIVQETNDTLNRVEALTNRQLIDELMIHQNHVDHDVLVEEVCKRLDPEFWSRRVAELKSS